MPGAAVRMTADLLAESDRRERELERQLAAEPVPLSAAIAEYAAEVAARGWYVFPCQADKTPRQSWRWDKWNTTDPARIRQWFDGAERVGIACAPSGLVVIDLDVPKPGYVFPAEWQAEPGIHDGKDVLATLCERAGEPWPDTYSTATMSGGWHLYFAAIPGRPVGNSASQVGPLIDVRGDGGYVIAYDPWNDTEPVRLPDWLADLASPPRRELARQPEPQARISRTDRYVRAALEAETADVANAPQGGRNDQLNKSAYALARLVTAGQLDQSVAWSGLTAAARHAGLTDTEITRTLRSAFTARQVQG